MAKMVIPDKICPHCGGNEWYISQEYTKYRCVKCSITSSRKYICKNREKVNAVSRKYYQKNRENLRGKTSRWNSRNPDKAKVIRTKSAKKKIANMNDSYIAEILIALAKRTGVILKRHDITDEEINKYREHLKKVRTLKKVRKMETSLQTGRPERLVLPKTDNQEKLTKTGGAWPGTVTTKDMTPKERQQVYTARHNAKMAPIKTAEKQKKRDEKFNSKLKDMVDREIEKEHPTSVLQFEQLVEITSKPEVVKVKVEEPIEDIVDEFKRIEARRQEILQEVEMFNNYVESFKINLS